jgi:DNA-binding LacI/PurR family transcriptional regulator
MEGGEMAVSYLLSLGHRNIGFISSPTTVTSRQDRLLGYRKALEKARIPYDKRRVLVYEGEEDECLDVTYEFQVGLALGKRLLEDNPETTAIFAANDMIAIGAIKAIQALGLSVPDDVSVIGFDDVPIAQMCIPPLTTLAQPKYEIGKAATEMLITRVEQGANFDYVGTKLFSPKLVERESCRPPNRRL